MITLIETVINQYYFIYNNQYYSQQEGLAMGAPSSVVLSEIFIQGLEHNQLCQTLTKHKVINYFRYVDDTLKIHDKTKTNIDKVLTEFNNLYENLQFTVEKEGNKEINYLDITVNRKFTKFMFNIHRKPTTTSSVTHSTSCHPTEHEIAAFNYLYNRVIKYHFRTAKNKTN
jgi:hypothetical protein